MMPPCVTILNKGPTKKQLAHSYVYTIKVVKRKNIKTIISFSRIEWLFICTILNMLHQKTIHTKFGWNWPSGSIEDFLKISNFAYLSPPEKKGWLFIYR